MNCPTLPELRYDEFSQRLIGRLAGQRVPVIGSLELTFRCNLRCAHCFVAAGNDSDLVKAELSTDEWRGILDQLADAGVLWLLMTGGEALTRPDFQDIYLYAKRKGFIITLFTNGTTVTSAIADLLMEWPPFAIEVSLYGRTPAVYEAVTRIPGSHARCIRGIELLLERELPVRLKTPLMTLNKGELNDIREYAEGLELEFRFDPMITAGLHSEDGPRRLRLTPEEIVAFDLNDPKRVHAWEEFCDKYGEAPSERSHAYVCGAGIHSFHIDPYGKLSLCMMSREGAYDLRTGSFQEGWEKVLPQIRYRQASENYTCTSCELLPLCGQCPGWSQMEHGAPDKPVEFLCRVAHLRAEHFIS